MKRLTFIILPALAILCGCATVQPSNQSAVVRAEQVLSISLAAIDSFLAFESRRRADVPAEVREIASRVRAKASTAFDSANRLRLAYKANRNDKGEADLLTALAGVDALVAEIRVWVPRTTASGTDGATASLIAEAQASKSASTGSWVALVPVFVDLAREIYVVVNRARESAKQDAEWDVAAEDAFATRLAAIRSSPHWK